MKIKNGLFSILVLLLFFKPLYSQRKAWDIRTITNKKITEAYLTNLEKDRLFVKVNNKIQSLHLDSIKTLQYKSTSFASLLGTIGGILVGGYLANQFEQKTSVDKKDSGSSTAVGSGLGMLVGGLVGYKAGCIAGGDKEFDLYLVKNRDRKRKILLKLIEDD